MFSNRYVDSLSMFCHVPCPDLENIEGERCKNSFRPRPSAEWEPKVNATNRRNKEDICSRRSHLSVFIISFDDDATKPSADCSLWWVYESWNRSWRDGKHIEDVATSVAYNNTSDALCYSPKMYINNIAVYESYWFWTWGDLACGVKNVRVSVCITIGVMTLLPVNVLL